MTITGPEREDAEIRQLLLAEHFAQAEEQLKVYWAGPQVQSNPALHANALYYRARLDYQSGFLTQALERARAALPSLTSRETLRGDEVVIQCLHLLAELHFDHARYTDSIGYYQRWAADLMTEETPAPIRAENYLCLALDQLYNYTYSTQVSTARLGRSLLDEQLARYPDKYARLLGAEGQGLKKYADRLPDSIRHELLWESAALMDRAAELFQSIHSIRWREAQREKVIIVSRFKDRGLFQEALAPLDSSAPAAAPFGFPDRLRGYFHHRMGNVDSVLFYYQRFRSQAPPFDFHLTDETLWTLVQYSLRAGDLELARSSVRDHMVFYGCLDVTAGDMTVDQLLRGYPNTRRCQYALCDYGRYQLARFNVDGDAGALDYARQAFSFLLDHWETVFTTGEEESALMQLTDITYKVVHNATAADFYADQRYATSLSANDLLNTLERTRTFLLLNDRLQPSDSLRPWQSRINELKERELRGGNILPQERMELVKLSRRHREVNAELRGSRNEAADRVRGQELDIRRIQNQLSSTEAILHFGEGDGRLVAQYIDRQGSKSYALPPTDTLRDSIAAYLNLLESGIRDADPGRFKALSRYLFTTVVQPVYDRLKNRSSLLVVPAGPLHRLPFATLITTPTSATSWDSLPYLLDRVEIRYAPSLRIESLNVSARPESYRDRSVGSWTHPELTYYFKPAERSLRAVAAPGSVFFTGSQCSSATFDRRLGEFDIVNLSLHARGSVLSRYGNYLYFAPADSMNAVTLPRLDCRAKLVMLIGCETGRGQQTVAEGTFSIARGFQQLGVPDVVYSLWRVPVVTSAELQGRFYRQLFSGEGPAAALTAAQRELRGQPRYAFPGYWGGLVKG